MFFYSVLDSLNDGRVIRKAAKVIVQLLGIFQIVVALIVIVAVLKLSFSVESTVATLGGLLFTILFIATQACVVQVYFYRARSIDQLGTSPFTVIPIISILFRLAGESGATLLAGLGVGGCLFAWLAGSIVGEVPLLPGGFSGYGANNFLLGLVIFGYCFILGLAALVSAYFFAEVTGLFADIARNVSRIAASKQPAEVERGGARPALPAAPVRPTAAPRVRRCPSCQSELEPDSAFCTTCGTRV